MTQFGLTLETVSQRAGCTMVEAYKALHLQHFRLLPLIIVARVRLAMEDILNECGWRGRKDRLWTDYDARLKKILQESNKAPSAQRRLRDRRTLSR